MLKVEAKGPVLRLTLNRPEVRNAFNAALIQALTEAVAGADPSIRAIVIAGKGNAFCAGGDLQWMREAASYTEEQNYADARRLAALFEAIASSPAVVIARVIGPCFGGGCGLVAASDVAIASQDAVFAFSEVRLGLIPATISPFVIPKIGAGNARALFSTGEAFDAQRALRIGLVHAVAEAGDVDAEIDKRLKAILSAGPRAVASAKALSQEPVLELDAAARKLAQARAGDEAKEGVSAFLDKRPASYVTQVPE